jgi:hypothetical protein
VELELGTFSEGGTLGTLGLGYAGIPISKNLRFSEIGTKK